MGSAAFPQGFADAGSGVCESCGRAPARRITVRRHIGLLVLQQFVTVRVLACRPCGRALVRRYTGRTLWQGWWGAISFFFSWFVLASNAFAWTRLGRLDPPSLSGALVEGESPGFGEADRDGKGRRLGLVFAVVAGGVVMLGFAGWAWDASHPDHAGGHGRPAPVAPVEQAITNGEPFVTEDGQEVEVIDADCTGEGEEASEGYTHFRCALTFANGTFDDVIVHLLPGDELFFKSSPQGVAR